MSSVRQGQRDAGTLKARRGRLNRGLGIRECGLGTGKWRAARTHQSPIPSPQSRNASGGASRGGHLRGEIAFLLLDAFAELEADIVLDRDVGAGFLALGGDD